MRALKKIRYDINNELRRTETNPGYSELVRVRISSLLSLLFAPAHERAPPAPAVHCDRAARGDDGDLGILKEGLK